MATTEIDREREEYPQITQITQIESLEVRSLCFELCAFFFETPWQTDKGQSTKNKVLSTKF